MRSMNIQISLELDPSMVIEGSIVVLAVLASLALVGCRDASERKSVV